MSFVAHKQMLAILVAAATLHLLLLYHLSLGPRTRWNKTDQTAMSFTLQRVREVCRRHRLQGSGGFAWEDGYGILLDEEHKIAMCENAKVQTKPLLLMQCFLNTCDSTSLIQSIPLIQVKLSLHLVKLGRPEVNTVLYIRYTGTISISNTDVSLMCFNLRGLSSALNRLKRHLIK